MAPLYDSISPDGRALSPDGHDYTAIVFFNDVFLSAAHFLEILHQHVMQQAVSVSGRLRAYCSVQMHHTCTGLTRRT